MSDQVTPSTSGVLHGPSGQRRPVDLTRTAGGREGLSGWVHFGAVMMTIIGCFGVIEGLAALLRPTTYLTVNGTVLSIDLTVWGWVHLILGALLIITGVSLLREAPAWARTVGALLAALSALVQMAWLPASPITSVLMITFDVIVIYALAATWSDR